MNSSMKEKQTHRHREQTCGCQGVGVGEDLGAKNINLFILKKQGPTIQHREPYSISYDKPQWKRMFKKGMYIYV